MEAVSNLTKRELDLILTSSGGSMEAAESVMGYLRTRFDHIRCIVPVAAMSAATMMALACRTWNHAIRERLWPLDPPPRRAQWATTTASGPHYTPRLVASGPGSTR